MRRCGNKALVALREPEELWIDFALALWRMHHLLHLVGVNNSFYIFLLQLEQHLQDSRVADQHRNQPDFVRSLQRFDDGRLDAFSRTRRKKRSDRDRPYGNRQSNASSTWRTPLRGVSLGM